MEAARDYVAGVLAGREAVVSNSPFLAECGIASLPGVRTGVRDEPRPAEQTSSKLLITGPSRTGDIEQILVRGVHGPGEYHLVVV